MYQFDCVFFYSLARTAVTCLMRLHAVKKRGPVPCSFYLDQILQNSGIHNKEEFFQPLNLHREKLNECLPKVLSILCY